MENNYFLLLRKGYIIRNAQSISAKCLHITTESQKLCHNVVYLDMDEQLRQNVYINYFKEKDDHFFGNMDAACILEIEGHIYVFGYSKFSKSDKTFLTSYLH